MAASPIDGLERAQTNRAGVRGRRSRIYLSASDFGAIQRDAARSDKIADRIQVALRILT